MSFGNGGVQRQKCAMSARRLNSGENKVFFVVVANRTQNNCTKQRGAANMFTFLTRLVAMYIWSGRRAHDYR